MELMKHVLKAKEAFAEAYNAIDVATANRNEQKAKLKKMVADLKLIPEVQQEKGDAIKAEYAKAMAEINKALEQKIAEAEKGFLKEVDAYYMPTGLSIVEEDVRLLNSGIVLTESELESLVEKNGDNLTMIRLLAQYAGDKHIHTSDVCKMAFARAMLAGKAEKDAFALFISLAGNAVRMANQGMAGDDSYIRTTDKLEEYVQETEKAILNAKVFLDEATRAEIAKMNEAENATMNDKMGTVQVEYR